MLLDRGFQVHNTGYPEAQRVLDHDRLDLQLFDKGALVRVGDRLHRLGDPTRAARPGRCRACAPRRRAWPTSCASCCWPPQDGLGAPAALLARPETTTRELFRQRGLSDEVVDRFLRPFLSGVFLEDRLDTSQPRLRRRLALVRPRARSASPRAGMGAMPAQLAARLRPGVLRLDAPGRGAARAPARSSSRPPPRPPARLLPGLDVPPMRSVTTHYHLAPEPPVAERRDRARRRAARPGGQHGRAEQRRAVLRARTAPGQQQRRQRRRRPSPPCAPTSRGSTASTRPAGSTSRAYDVREALPDQRPPMGRLRRPVRVRDGVYVCGDHRDSGSIQGALVSGRRAAAAVLAGPGR